MNKCANCDMYAPYRLNDPGANPIDVCGAHVPAHLLIRVERGQFSITAEDVEPTSDAVEDKKSASTLSASEKTTKK